MRESMDSDQTDVGDAVLSIMFILFVALMVGTIAWSWTKNGTALEAERADMCRDKCSIVSGSAVYASDGKCYCILK